MSDTVEFKIEGLDSLLGKLEEVSYDVKRKGGRYALRKAAEIVRASAQANAQRIDNPETAENISKNIASRWNGRLFKRTGDLGFRIGVLGGARIPKSKPKGTEPGGPGGDTRYWAFVEFGHETARANPFMRQALADNISEVTSTFVTEYEKAIDRAIRRAQKKR
ncbi:HK97-gp10 family putative phage morphogenesis protein [Pseudomonas nicosulfuronedens]